MGLSPKYNSVDGFVPRRDERPIGLPPVSDRQHRQRQLRAAAVTPARTIPIDQYHYPRGLEPQDIAASLDGLGQTRPQSVTPVKSAGKKRFSRPGKRFFRFTLVLLAGLVVAAGSWLGYRAYLASGSIFNGNVLGLIQSRPLKKDANGRTNLLIVGTSEDDPGQTGAYLTDSMLVASIDQKTKRADMFSIPRDLYVRFGRACNSGYEGKINEYFSCVNDDTKSADAEQERLKATQKFVGEIFGLDIQYGVHVNQTVIKEAVNAVGGVDVDIQGSNGASGILDRNFDWRCKYRCYLVKYKNGVQRLNGEQALYLAMARGNTAPTYGLGNSNFDREKNQQKILVALKEKAVSTGTLTDITKISRLIDSMGNNLRTNFDTTEVRSAAKLAMDIPSNNIQRVSFVEEGNPLVVGSEYNGASVVVPVAGMFEYTQLREFVKERLSSGPPSTPAAPTVKEEPTVSVLNGSGVAGAAQKEADRLTGEGFTVKSVANAPAGTYGKIEIYSFADKMPTSTAKLKSLYGVDVRPGKDNAALGTYAGDNFVVIIGRG